MLCLSERRAFVNADYNIVTVVSQAQFVMVWHGQHVWFKYGAKKKIFCYPSKQEHSPCADGKESNSCTKQTCLA